jgi:hypothetical protein
VPSLKDLGYCSQTRFELSYRKPRARSGDNYEHRNGTERTTSPNLSVYNLHLLVRMAMATIPSLKHGQTDHNGTSSLRDAKVSFRRRKISTQNAVGYNFFSIITITSTRPKLVPNFGRQCYYSSAAQFIRKRKARFFHARTYKIKNTATFIPLYR